MWIIETNTFSICITKMFGSLLKKVAVLNTCYVELEYVVSCSPWAPVLDCSSTVTGKEKKMVAWT